jgi:hypothetical protein
VFRYSQKPLNDVPRARIRSLTITAIVLIAVFNGADVVTTHFVLAHKGVEVNPLSSALLSNNSLLWVKLTLVGLAAVLALRLRPTIGLLLASWFVAGAYATAVLSNALILRLTG